MANAIDTALDGLIKKNDAAAKLSLDTSSDAYANARILLIALIVLALVLTFTVVQLITRSVSRPLSECIGARQSAENSAST